MFIDSISMKMQLGDLDFDKSEYDKITTEREHYTQTEFKWRNKSLGLSYIKIQPYNNEVIVNCSAKILRENYLKGFTVNTMEQLHSEINKYITCSLDDVVNATVHRADITANLYFDSREEKEKSVKVLKLGKSNVAYQVNDYTEKGEGAAFVKKIKGQKDRIIYYNKEQEIHKSSNKEIAEILYKHKQIEPLSRILRVERNCCSYERLRKAAGVTKNVENRKILNKEIERDIGNIGRTNRQKVARYIDAINNPNYTQEVTFKNLIESKANPLYHMHQDVFKYADMVTLFTDYRDYNVALKHLGWENMYLRANSSIDTMLQFVKEVSKRSAFFKRKKEILEWYAYYTKNDDCNCVLEDVNYIGMLNRIGMMLAYETMKDVA